jgi:ferrous iron transport protein B
MQTESTKVPPQLASNATFILIGLESSGKSALFRSLTGYATGDENNVRGSTIHVRSGRLPGERGVLIDTPGIRLKDDSLTTEIALRNIEQDATILLVARGTHAKNEIEDLLEALQQRLVGHPVSVIITFGDRAPAELRTAIDEYEQSLGVPMTVVNARKMSDGDREAIFAAMRHAASIRPKSPRIVFLESVPVVQPSTTLFEHPALGPWLSLLVIFLLFAVPIFLAFVLAARVQPALDSRFIAPLTERLSPLQQTAPLAYALLAGGYGLLTLGPYSFIWAFPVVLFMGVSVALTEEVGLKDRITTALDPWMRGIGLSGRDLVPILTGFGCNVVAVLQTRSCSACTRRGCVAMIAFASACSYQIGASLSLFNSARHPWLFLPYVALLFGVGALHTRVWNHALRPRAATALADRAFLQKPTLSGAMWRVRAVLRQFLLTAMPIFLAICVVGSMLQYVGVLDYVASSLGPMLRRIGLPPTTAPGIVFSVIRKDGLLILNQNEGALIRELTISQVFVLVYLASTLTGCMVTLLTITKEFGLRWAARLAVQQGLTSIVSTLLLTIALREFGLSQ